MVTPAPTEREFASEMNSRLAELRANYIEHDLLEW